MADRVSNKYRIISIKNYDKYQGDGKRNGKRNGKQRDKQATNKRQQRKNDKKNKESKEEKESAAPLPPWAAAKGWSLEEYERWRNQ